MFGLRKYRQLSDEELILQNKARPNNKSLAIIYERYGPLVMGACMKYLKNIQEAEDMTSSIFEKLPEKILQHEIRYFKSWLYQMTKNECLMKLRKKKVYTQEVNEQILCSVEQEVDKAEKEVQIKQLELALEALKDKQKECVVLFYLEELSYQEISDRLRIDIKTVKSQIQNGKRNLKIKLEQSHEEE
ncbi:MAG: sigma-70 family RNA polymerase sigma factor [Bacteroidetes bacterium]|nr:sigma-70 family RNA polymerase sigma factor [Bacteroidota bacterium]